MTVDGLSGLERYMGIENEFLTFAKSDFDKKWRPSEEMQEKDFQSYFEQFKRANDFDRSPTAVRSANGFAYYIDGAEIELCTPPIRLRKGFATALADSLFTGRERIRTWNPDLVYTGYSMHWNITTHLSEGEKSWLPALLVPAALFGCTPLSMGVGVREKPNRVEVLTDSINNYNQIRAAALLLAATSIAYEKDALKVQARWTIDKESAYMNLSTGRKTTVETQIEIENASLQGIILRSTFQDYLEILRYNIHPYIAALGTPNEIEILDKYLRGERNLAIDEQAFYQEVATAHYSDGAYRPFINSKGQGTLLRSQKKPLPIENQLLGKAAQDKHTERLEWSSLMIAEPYDTIYAYSVTDVYEKLAQRQGVLLPEGVSVELESNPLHATYEVTINPSKITITHSEETPKVIQP